MTLRYFFTASLLLASGCAYQAPDDAQTEGDEPIGAVAQADEEENAFDDNGLIDNGLIDNGLIDNGLIDNGLDPETLPANVMTALRAVNTTGEYSRSLLKYMVGCALNNQQSFSFTWTEQGVDHNENYVGSLGLATEWASGPITTIQQKRVSACVAARTNMFGVHVRISLRGSTLTADSNERGSYPNREGAFWGTLFGSSLHLYSCYDANNVANSRGKNRVCASGNLNGGNTDFCLKITSMGPCSSVCTDNTDGADGYVSCNGESAASGLITTFLP